MKTNRKQIETISDARFRQYKSLLGPICEKIEKTGEELRKDENFNKTIKRIENLKGFKLC